MGGSSSQRRTDLAMSLINAVSVEELYTPELSDSFQENTCYWQEHNPHETPVEAVVTSPPKKKPTKARQKRMIQSVDAPRKIVWTYEEEIALAKGWVVISVNKKYGNARKEHGFWCEVLEYMETKTKQYGCQTYDMSMRQVARDTSHLILVRSTQSLNTNVGDNDEDGVKKIRRTMGRDKARAVGKNKRSKASGSSTMNDDALARLMVTEMTTHKKEQREAFLKIKMMEVECRK
uniref:No apical meristem-associated C-terminal domain-containing protein n=1 Tax=Tanacetum cinerariifolium TaxID=118510 RepID=A0A699J2U1_TANCI|nr:hypothetical protein [Tanacetum cinerariifolium]